MEPPPSLKYIASQGAFIHFHIIATQPVRAPLSHLSDIARSSYRSVNTNITTNDRQKINEKGDPYWNSVVNLLGKIDKCISFSILIWVCVDLHHHHYQKKDAEGESGRETGDERKNPPKPCSCFIYYTYRKWLWQTRWYDKSPI